MTVKELEEKLNKMTLEEFSKFVSLNYKKLLAEPKKLGAILRIYNKRVTSELKLKTKIKNEAVDELNSLDIGLWKGGDKNGR